MYPRIPYTQLAGSAVLQDAKSRQMDRPVEHRRDLPGNIIVVHGVNDVGTSYQAVEEGICAGLQERLLRPFKPATYRMPTSTDKTRLEDDPDDIFFKRKADAKTDSPIIPFYWGYREINDFVKTVNGQKTDRYGTRLDKDLSKGGGPFINATATIPDMWNKGGGVPLSWDIIKDAIRPLKTGPGRRYMVLAACRLAAMIAMIRDYEAKDTVSVVAHSQGCLVTLLAQALLLDEGKRPADTLILTHPPYSLEEDADIKVDIAECWSGGGDSGVTNEEYQHLGARQTLHARLQTLVNIVQGVVKEAKNEPPFSSLNLPGGSGIVHHTWNCAADRDNRGKVYLYFCPEDMTVALENVKGIGWQGVPDHIAGSRLKEVDLMNGGYLQPGSGNWKPFPVNRQPLSELGRGFYQRIFTAKSRQDPITGKVGPLRIGLPPHDVPLRIRGEDDKAHVEKNGRSFRADLPIATWPIDKQADPIAQRRGIRRINGEPLAKPCLADLTANQVDPDKIPATSVRARVQPQDRGPAEEVDPIDAATAVASGFGLRRWEEDVNVPDPHANFRKAGDKVPLSKAELDRITVKYNESKKIGGDPNVRPKIIAGYWNDRGNATALVEENVNVSRLRWQEEVSGKSFHGVIIGSRENHRRITAYDVSIGSGKASTDRNFYSYLCAVADWRLIKPTPRDKNRESILKWKEFISKFQVYWNVEDPIRKRLIEGNSDYYSSGVLPKPLPSLHGSLWLRVVSENVRGGRIAGRG